MKSRFLLTAAMLTSLWISGCGGDDDSPPSLPHHVSEIAAPTIGNFDIGVVDSTAARFYLASGNNEIASFSTITDTLNAPLATGAFAGDNTVDNDRTHNGPDGVIIIPGTSQLYVGDVNSVKVIDTTSGAVLQSIALSTSNVRVDEGCYDGDDGIVMVSSPDETPPFVNFISTASQTVVAKYTFPADTLGLEQCVYDPRSKSFLINNDGTTANPDGQIDVFTAASVVARLPQVTKSFPLPGCGPAGLALGPDNDMIVGCDPFPPLARQITLILDRSTGNVAATVPFGGSDEVAYDATTNRYFIPAFLHQADNVPGAFSTAIPTLGVIDGATRTLVAQLPMGSAAHSIGIDSSRHKVYVPHVAGAPGSPFALSGISVFSTD